MNPMNWQRHSHLVTFVSQEPSQVDCKAVEGVYTPELHVELFVKVIQGGTTESYWLHKSPTVSFHRTRFSQVHQAEYYLVPHAGFLPDVKLSPAMWQVSLPCDLGHEYHSSSRLLLGQECRKEPFWKVHAPLPEHLTQSKENKGRNLELTCVRQSNVKQPLSQPIQKLDPEIDTWDPQKNSFQMKRNKWQKERRIISLRWNWIETNIHYIWKRKEREVHYIFHLHKKKVYDDYSSHSRCVGYVRYRSLSFPHHTRKKNSKAILAPIQQ